MWSRFTENAKNVIYASQEIALSLGQPRVDVDHLFLGLMGLEDSVASQVIRAFGVTLDALASAIVPYLEQAEPLSPRDMTLTSLAKRTVDQAYDEARKLGNCFIGSEHLLLALIRSDFAVGGAFMALGMDLRRAESVVIELQMAADQGREPDLEEAMSFPPVYQARYYLARAMVERVLMEAWKLRGGSGQLGGEHLLFGLSKEGGRAQEILAKYGLSLEVLKEEIQRGEEN